ncbi:hypothetical protein [Limosilactobacillus secaliphilus]|uniref:Lipoprotein n=1 Tax=Limosilactobacillus secaliphilus TaxID=396268 RepID=A0A0R2IAN7_9LACO|nr:hypothetical protein [Limosilactobacillus secaliphilus]KRN59223.1 hypothetical protein IV45_GL000262 [Limosilactobacillus secaliphilus]
MKNILKVLSIITIVSCLVLVATGCGQRKADYSAKTAESALNSGKDIKGKTVKFTVQKLEPNSAFGYNMETGKHLNFVSNDNPKVKKGDTVIVKVKKVTSTMGSYVITYSHLSKQ